MVVDRSIRKPFGSPDVGIPSGIAGLDVNSLIAQIINSINVDTIPLKELTCYLTGNALDSALVYSDITGVNTKGLETGIDKGYFITTANVASAEAVLTGGTIKNFDPQNGTFWAEIISDANAANNTIIGISSIGNVFSDAGLSHVVCFRCVGTVLNSMVNDGTGGVVVSTGVTIVAGNKLQLKAVYTSTSQKFYVWISGAWVLKVTQNTKFPTNAGTMTFDILANSSPSTSRLLFFRVRQTT